MKLEGVPTTCHIHLCCTSVVDLTAEARALDNSSFQYRYVVAHCCIYFKVINKERHSLSLYVPKRGVTDVLYLMGLTRYLIVYQVLFVQPGTTLFLFMPGMLQSKVKALALLHNEAVLACGSWLLHMLCLLCIFRVGMCRWINMCPLGAT